MIRIEGLSKWFEPPRRPRHLALDDLSLGVGEGEFVSILGPSGCGKSTLLYMPKVAKRTPKPYLMALSMSSALATPSWRSRAASFIAKA